MMITKLHLQDFRNYADKAFSFERDKVVLLGRNGRGKTNVLEAIVLLSIGKSWREQSGSDLILRAGGNSPSSAKISGNFSGEILEGFIQPRSRSFTKNGKKIALKNLMGVMPALVFSPELLGIFSGSKDGRQRFFDRFFSQLDPGYRDILITVYRAHKQKSALLRSLTDGDHFPEVDEARALVAPWNDLLIENYPKLWKLREEFLGKLNRQITDELAIISGKDESIFIEQKLAEDLDPSEEGVRDFLAKNLRRELAARRNLLSATRDDFGFFLRDLPILSTASRGEERSVLLAMLASQKILLQEILGKNPILILDDVFSELDDDRQSHLSRICADSQVFFSTTHEEHVKGFGENIQKIWV